MPRPRLARAVVVVACVLVLGIVYFVATLTGDLLTAALNPRIRLAREG